MMQSGCVDLLTMMLTLGLQRLPFGGSVLQGGIQHQIRLSQQLKRQSPGQRILARHSWQLVNLRKSIDSDWDDQSVMAEREYLEWAKQLQQEQKEDDILGRVIAVIPVYGNEFEQVRGI